jgi:hypothetical protein
METTVNNGTSICDNQLSSLGNSSRIAWGAIFIGTIVSLGYEVLLNFLGIGLGLSAFDLNGEKMFQIGTGAIIWLAASGIISMGIGGYFVGLFSNVACNFKRGCHAVAAWSLATLITVLMTTAASGAFIGGGINIAKSSITAIIQNSAQTNSQQDADLSQNQASENTEQYNIKEKANSATNQMGKASIVLFFAFLLSGIASVAGAIFATKKAL